MSNSTSIPDNPIQGPNQTSRNSISHPIVKMRVLIFPSLTVVALALLPTVSAFPCVFARSAKQSKEAEGSPRRGFRTV